MPIFANGENMNAIPCPFNSFIISQWNEFLQMHFRSYHIYAIVYCIAPTCTQFLFFCAISFTHTHTHARTQIPFTSWIFSFSSGLYRMHPRTKGRRKKKSWERVRERLVFGIQYDNDVVDGKNWGKIALLLSSTMNVLRQRRIFMHIAQCTFIGGKKLKAEKRDRDRELERDWIIGGEWMSWIRISDSYSVVNWFLNQKWDRKPLSCISLD